MRLDLTEILQEVGRNLPYEVHEPPLVDEDVECTQPIMGRISFNNTGGTLLVRGNAKTSVALACSRCGEYFEQSVALPIDEQFELRHNNVGPRSPHSLVVVEEDESPVAGKLFDGHVFDLTEMLRQYLLLEEPTQPLPPTRKDGRCAHCHRRPDEVLQTEAEATTENSAAINPAFARLSELLEKQKASGQKADSEQQERPFPDDPS